MLNDIGSRVLLSEEEIDQMTDEDGNLWILGLEDPVAFNTQEEDQERFITYASDPSLSSPRRFDDRVT